MTVGNVEKLSVIQVVKFCLRKDVEKSRNSFLLNPNLQKNKSYYMNFDILYIYKGIYNSCFYD